MMGKGHAVSGAAAWLALSATGRLDSLDLASWEVVAAAGLVAGASLLPDLDHPSATAARSGGMIGRGISAGLGAAAGGHRHGLHSLLAIGGFTIATMFAARWMVEVPVAGQVPMGSVLIAAALAVFATRAMKWGRAGLIRLWATTIAGAIAAVMFAPALMSALPAVVLVGVLVHLAGDFITTGGLPLTWPVNVKPPKSLREVPVLSAVWKPNGYVAVPVLGNAGSVREWVLVAALSVYVIAGAYGVLTGAGGGVEVLRALGG